MKFTELWKALREAYPEQPRAFHVIAARYYLGVETDLQPLTVPRRRGRRPVITVAQMEEIKRNR